MVGNFPEKSTGEMNKQLEYPIPMKFWWELTVGGATHFTGSCFIPTKHGEGLAFIVDLPEST